MPNRSQRHKLEFQGARPAPPDPDPPPPVPGPPVLTSISPTGGSKVVNQRVVFTGTGFTQDAVLVCSTNPDWLVEGEIVCQQTETFKTTQLVTVFDFGLEYGEQNAQVWVRQASGESNTKTFNWV